MNERDLVFDYSDFIWVLDGSCAHETFAAAADNPQFEGHVLAERGVVRGFIVPDYGAVKVSFKPDILYRGGKLEDYKKTSAFKIDKIPIEGVDFTWVAQGNLYAYVLDTYITDKELYPDGPDWPDYKGIHAISVWAWMRDWGPRFSKLSSNPFKEIPLPVWSKEDTEKYAVERIHLHMKADEAKVATDVPCCTGTERWCKIADRGSDVFVPGPRCRGKKDGTGYCGVAKFCPYFQEYLEMKGGKYAKDEEEAL